MGYPGDRQQRRQPYRPYETPQPAGDLRPGAEPPEHAAEPASWPASQERDPGRRPWSHAEERQVEGASAHGADEEGDLPQASWERTAAAREQQGNASSEPPRYRGAFEPQGPSRPYESRQARPFQSSPGQGHSSGLDTGPFGAQSVRTDEQPSSRSEGASQFRQGGSGSQTGPSSRRGDGGDRTTATSLPRPPKDTRRSEPEPAERRPRGPIVLVGGVAALIVAVAAGIVVMSRVPDPAASAAKATETPSQAAPMVAPPDDKYGFAASRTTDPQPLTLNEVFGRKKVSAHGRSYVMTVRRADKKCKNAVHGTDIQKALKAGDCTQFLRASFRDGPGKLIGTVGVANLKTAAAVKKGAKAGTGGELEDYVSPLQGKDSATKLLGTGDSYATAWGQGHYLVLLWFQYKDGHKPSKTELKRLNRAAVDITEATVFSALDTRALTGARTN